MTKANITILGGTGTLGQALVPAIFEKWPKANITIVSRDEHKQAAMAKRFKSCKYAIADIRDRDSIGEHLEGRDLVFHVAALKHVDILESCPIESIKTNVLATQTLASEAVKFKVPHFIFSSTDKAIDPINTYGFSKALSEKILIDFNKKQSTTNFSIYRWGNVVGSQGSAIPFFVKTLRSEKKVYLTDLKMTRFWIPIDWAVQYMLHTFHNARKDQAMVPPTMKAAKVDQVVAVISHILGIDSYEIEDIGIRPGEKIHEAMYSMHTSEFLTSQTAEKYTFSELTDLLRPVVQNCLSKEGV